MVRQRFHSYVRRAGRWLVLPAAIAVLTSSGRAADDARALRLVPFPKEVHLEAGQLEPRLERSCSKRPPIGCHCWRHCWRASSRGLAAPQPRPLAEDRHLLRLIGRGGAAIPRACRVTGGPRETMPCASLPAAWPSRAAARPAFCTVHKPWWKTATPSPAGADDPRLAFAPLAVFSE